LEPILGKNDAENFHMFAESVGRVRPKSLEPSSPCRPTLTLAGPRCPACNLFGRQGLGVGGSGGVGSVVRREWSCASLLRHPKCIVGSSLKPSCVRNHRTPPVRIIKIVMLNNPNQNSLGKAARSPNPQKGGISSSRICIIVCGSMGGLQGLEEKLLS